MILRVKNKGFTLIEMLVAISIISIMSVGVAINLGSFRSSSTLDIETEELSSVIRRAQLWALTGQVRAGERPPGGWGVHLVECGSGPCSYSVFADMGSGDHIYNAADDDEVLVFTMNKLVNIKTLEPASGSVVDIVFTAPAADMFINGLQTDTEAVITLDVPLQSLEAIVRVDRESGRINIE